MYLQQLFLYQWGNSIYSATGYDAVSGCTATASHSIKVFDCIGVTENEKFVFSLHPNPNPGTFYTQHDISALRVIDMLGRNVPYTRTKTAAGEWQYTLNEVRAGVCVLVDENGRSLGRIVVIPR